MLAGQHFHDDLFIVVGAVVARQGTLEEAVIPLSVEESGFIEAGFLEAMVYVCGEDEVVFVLNQPQ